MDANRGFTLIELLVVLAILAMLAAVVAPRVMNALGSSKARTARIQVEELGAALDLYRLDVGRYPSSLEALVQDVSPGWNGPYLKKKRLPADPWGNPYHYRFPGEHGDYDLFSLGADGRPGGEGEDGDILGWE
jgi:general secretion pathway protein G